MALLKTNVNWSERANNWYIKSLNEKNTSSFVQQIEKQNQFNPTAELLRLYYFIHDIRINLNDELNDIPCITALHDDYLFFLVYRIFCSEIYENNIIKIDNLLYPANKITEANDQTLISMVCPISLDNKIFDKLNIELLKFDSEVLKKFGFDSVNSVIDLLKKIENSYNQAYKKLVETTQNPLIISLTSKNDSEKNLKKNLLIDEHHKLYKDKDIHIHFSTWPDGYTPAEVQINKLTELAEKIANLPNNYTVMVHCKGGIGRSGTFLTLVKIIKSLKSSALVANPQDYINNIEGIKEETKKIFKSALKDIRLNITLDNDPLSFEYQTVNDNQKKLIKYIFQKLVFKYMNLDETKFEISIPKFKSSMANILRLFSVDKTNSESITFITKINKKISKHAESFMTTYKKQNNQIHLSK